jgi:peptidyl-tRNA hydrolase, PTH1 family
VLGLGNPGAEYARSRHNVGFEVVDELARRRSVSLAKSRLSAIVAESLFGDQRVVLACPTTYMNLSGEAAVALIRRYGIDEASQIIVVQDELDLEPGIVRIKAGGGLAGHNGLRSLTQHLHTQDYLRVRIGVGKPPSKAAGINHVLKKIPKAERELLDVAVQVAADAAESIISIGVGLTMTAFNGR